jgi:hypothetical protein
MHRRWIEHTSVWRTGPMTFWVHRAQGADVWSETADLIPPRPKPVAGQGYASYFVDYDGFVFHFASLDEMRECIAILSKKLLPTTRSLSAGAGAGPNSHWLSRLPARVKPWSYRDRATRYLRKWLIELENADPCPTKKKGRAKSAARATLKRRSPLTK